VNFFENIFFEIAMSIASLMQSFSVGSRIALENDHGEVGIIADFIP
jgi:hypothetical protein